MHPAPAPMAGKAGARFDRPGAAKVYAASMMLYALSIWQMVSRRV